MVGDAVGVFGRTVEDVALLRRTIYGRRVPPAQAFVGADQAALALLYNADGSHGRQRLLFAVNPLGSQTFDKANPKSEVTLSPGEKLRFRYLVVVHPGLSAARIGDLYKSWAAKK